MRCDNTKTKATAADKTRAKPAHDCTASASKPSRNLVASSDKSTPASATPDPSGGRLRTKVAEHGSPAKSSSTGVPLKNRNRKRADDDDDPGS